jgi:predicted component of type VI protein secretion system
MLAGSRPIVVPDKDILAEKTHKDVIKSFISRMQTNDRVSLVDASIQDDNDFQIVEAETPSPKTFSSRPATPVTAQALNTVKRQGSPFLMPPITPRKETPPSTVPSSTTKSSPMELAPEIAKSVPKSSTDEFVKPFDKPSSAKKVPQRQSPLPVFASPAPKTPVFPSKLVNISPFAKQASPLNILGRLHPQESSEGKY